MWSTSEESYLSTRGENGFPFVSETSRRTLLCTQPAIQVYRWHFVGERRRRPLWSSGQSFWLQIHRSRVRSRRYQIFCVVVGLERGPLSLVSLMRSIEELLEWKSSGSRSRKQRLTAVGTRWADHVTPLYPQKLALTSPTGGGRSVGMVRVRTKATEFFFKDVEAWSSPLNST